MNAVARARLANIGLALCAILSVLAVVWTGDTPTRAESEVRRRHLLPVFRLDEVNRLEVAQGVRRAVLVRRAEPARAQGTASQEGPDPDELPDEASGEPGSDAELFGLPASEWSLVEPFETDANSAPVESLLGTLRYATWEREVSAEESSGAAAGPEALVSVQAVAIGMGDRSYRIELGPDSVSPAGSKYVKVTQADGKPRTYVIKKKLAAELFVDVDAFRGRQVVPYRKSSVDRLILSSAAGVRRLRRVGSDFHFDEMQENQRADRLGVDRIFMALARASLDPFIDVPVATAALSTDASVRVSIVPAAKEKAEASLEFGGICPGAPGKTVALRHLPEPVAGCVDRSVLLALREPAAVLIDRRLFALRADEVDGVRIEQGDQVLDFARQGDGFVLRAPREASLSSTAASDRLERILSVEGDLLLGRDKPSLPAEFQGTTVTLESSARLGQDAVKETVKVTAPLADGRRRVFREADGAVLVVSGEASLALAADATLLKEQQVFDYPLSQVRRIAISGPNKQVIERDAAGALTLIEPKGHDIDGGLAMELIDQLRTLRALRWVTDRAGGGFGLDKPRIEVRLTLEVDGAKVERTLSLGGSANGGFYASVDRDPGVFVAPRSLDRVLRTWLLDRSGFSAERDSIVEITLNAQDRGSILLRRVAGELTPQKGSTSFDLERIDELLDVLESLRPEGTVHLGPASPGEGFRRPILSVIVRRQSPENIGIPPIRFSVGARDSFRDASIYYARLGSINATFALPREQIQRLLDLF